MIVHALKSYLREGVPLTCRCCFLWHSKMWFPIFRTMLQRTVTKTTSSRGSFLPGHRYSPVKQQRDFFFKFQTLFAFLHTVHSTKAGKDPPPRSRPSSPVHSAQLEKTPPTPAEPWNKFVPSRKLWKFLLLVVIGSGCASLCGFHAAKT